ncbi:hypothetical protein ACSS6W_002456 [Trichoderma asperelloides]
MVVRSRMPSIQSATSALYRASQSQAPRIPQPAPLMASDDSTPPEQVIERPSLISPISPLGLLNLHKRDAPAPRVTKIGPL